MFIGALRVIHYTAYNLQQDLLFFSKYDVLLKQLKIVFKRDSSSVNSFSFWFGPLNTLMVVLDVFTEVQQRWQPLHLTHLSTM